jgi:cytochrome oxidase Cu insertion factor (SCO1/SenC/PrrC family)
VNDAVPALRLVYENNSQRKLAHRLDHVHRVLISSDPKEDTPVTLLRTASEQPSAHFDGLVAADEPLKKSRVVAR